MFQSSLVQNPVLLFEMLRYIMWSRGREDGQLALFVIVREPLMHDLFNIGPSQVGRFHRRGFHRTICLGFYFWKPHN